MDYEKYSIIDLGIYSFLANYSIKANLPKQKQTIRKASISLYATTKQHLGSIYYISYFISFMN